MNQDSSAPEIELHDIGDLANSHHLRPQPTQPHQLRGRTISISESLEHYDSRSRPQSPLSTNEHPLLQIEQTSSGNPPLYFHVGEQRDQGTKKCRSRRKPMGHPFVLPPSHSSLGCYDNYPFVEFPWSLLARLRASPPKCHVASPTICCQSTRGDNGCVLDSHRHTSDST